MASFYGPFLSVVIGLYFFTGFCSGRIGKVIFLIFLIRTRALGFTGFGVYCGHLRFRGFRCERCAQYPTAYQPKSLELKLNPLSPTTRFRDLGFRVLRGLGGPINPQTLC